MENMLTVKQAAEILQLHHRTIQRMIARGEIKAVKVANRWRIRRQDLEDYMNNQSDL